MTTNTDLILGVLVGIIIGFIGKWIWNIVKKRYSQKEDWVEVDLSDDENFIHEDFCDTKGLKDYE